MSSYGCHGVAVCWLRLSQAIKAILTFPKCSGMMALMRFGTDLRAKAILALEEAVHDCRYARVRRTFAIRFALAYLWSITQRERMPFKELWDALDSDNDVFRFSVADQALIVIHGQLGIERDHDQSMEMWSRWQAEHRRWNGG